MMNMAGLDGMGGDQRGVVEAAASAAVKSHVLTFASLALALEIGAHALVRCGFTEILI